ncbi:hypothetical protein CHU98_g6834 [Xylaria longipes]|nr:hypothetical protein CHU98_g6834 [Xylaria longipes]
MRKRMVWYKSAGKKFSEANWRGRRDKQPSRAFTVRRYKAEKRKFVVAVGTGTTSERPRAVCSLAGMGERLHAACTGRSGVAVAVAVAAAAAATAAAEIGIFGIDEREGERDAAELWQPGSGSRSGSNGRWKGGVVGWRKDADARCRRWWEGPEAPDPVDLIRH